MGEDCRFVWVRRSWSDFRHIARCRRCDILDVHASSFETMCPGPDVLLYGFVGCDAIEYGELGHSCREGTGPHRLEVCIARKDNDSALFAELRREAGDLAGRPAGSAAKPAR